MVDPESRRDGISALSREQRWELAYALLQRSDAPSDARRAFARKHPTAPQEMIDTATFHVYVDGPEAVLSWLADAELFLRDSNHELCQGVTAHLLYHVYNWHQFQALLPEGKPGVLERLDDLKQLAADGDLDAVQQVVEEIESLLGGHVDSPDFQ